MIIARRVAVTLLALVGLVVAALGLWLAVVLGPSGTARFTARATGPVVIGADVLGELDVPVTVTAYQGAGGAGEAGNGIFLAEARSSEVASVVAGARVLEATKARFPARVLDLAPTGSGDLADPSGLDVWRATGRGALEVTDAGSDAVLVVPTGPTGTDPVTVVMTRKHSTWFLEAVVAVVIGAIVAGASGWWLVRQLGHLVPYGRPGARRRAASRSVTDEPGTSQAVRTAGTSAAGEPDGASADPAAATASTPEARP
ncbi:hypothetical protein V3N99_03970 [Dermatophilaceae bacterium Soc4.6]